MQPLSLILAHPPDRLTPAIEAACRRLSPTASPQFVKRQPPPDAVVNKCTFNVRRFIESNPGEMVLGWEVCVWDGVLIECIGHAVVHHDGQYRCVTPSRYASSRLLFLPDASLTFDFTDPTARMPSIQLALSTRPDVTRLIEVESLERQIKITYPVSSGQMVIGGADAVRLQQLIREKQRLTLKVILATSDHNTRCPCGSGKKLRKCHRSDIERSLQLM
jgi:hypothetical protein